MIELERNVWLNISDVEIGSLEEIWKADTQHMYKIINSLPISGNTVIDVACGTGAYYPLLSSKYTAYLGIDSSVKMLEIAKRKYPSAKFVLNDVKQLNNYPDLSFDMVFCMSLLIHMPLHIVEHTLKELWRISNRHILFNVQVTDSETCDYDGSYGEYVSIVNRYDINRIIDQLQDKKHTLEIVYNDKIIKVQECKHIKDDRKLNAKSGFQGHLFSIEKNE